MKAREGATMRRCVAVLAGAFALAGAAPPASQSAHRTYTIIIDKMAFGPVPAGLRAGDTIKWVNRDLFRHTATARDRSFDVDLAPGSSASTTLKRPGRIGFFCKFHPGMKGVLAVAR